MIEIRALGPAEVTIDGRPAPAELLWRKNLALLVYLARSPRLTRSREHLMGLLWGDKPETAARHSLREALRVLRQVAGESFLATEGDRVTINAGEVTIDVDRFNALAAAGDHAAAAQLAVGNFLEGFGVPDAPPFEDWLAGEQLNTRRRAVEVLVKRAEDLQRAGDLGAAAECAHRALTFEPASAAAVRSLIRVHALRGERAEALSVYDAFAERLRSQLGTEPDAATERLAAQVRKDRQWRDQSAPARSGAATRRAPLAGRDGELARLVDAWQATVAGRSGAAVIRGPAGAGRTRLMEELIARARLDGAACAAVRGAPADRASAWSGIMGLARGGLLAAQGLAGAAPGALAAFAQSIDEWADQFPAARGAAPMSPDAALGDVLRVAAGEQPVLLAFDDAHWLDPESLGALQVIVRDLHSLPVFIVVTAAPHPPREEIDQLASRLGRDVPGAAVSALPLGPEPLRQLAAWAMPSYSPAQVDRLARRIAADSAGLPLLAVELLHAVALGLDLHGTPSSWPEPQRTLDQSLPGDLPETLIAAIRIGFRRLSANAQAVVAAAAVLEGRADTARLAQASALDPAALAVALDEAEWERWIAADGRGYGIVARLAKDVIATDLITEGQRQRILSRS
ncbi:MAG TPA: AAA family ATPase [Gemmatimonadales bacterium]|jgi:DNA-binding SARP family transcriptional activator